MQDAWMIRSRAKRRQCACARLAAAFMGYVHDLYVCVLPLAVCAIRAGRIASTFLVQHLLITTLKMYAEKDYPGTHRSPLGPSSLRAVSSNPGMRAADELVASIVRRRRGRTQDRFNLRFDDRFALM